MGSLKINTGYNHFDFKSNLGLTSLHNLTSFVSMA